MILLLVLPDVLVIFFINAVICVCSPSPHPFHHILSTLLLVEYFVSPYSWLLGLLFIVHIIYALLLLLSTASFFMIHS